MNRLLLLAILLVLLFSTIVWGKYQVSRPPSTYLVHLANRQQISPTFVPKQFSDKTLRFSFTYPGNYQIIEKDSQHVVLGIAGQTDKNGKPYPALSIAKNQKNYDAYPTCSPVPNYNWPCTSSLQKGSIYDVSSIAGKKIKVYDVGYGNDSGAVIYQTQEEPFIEMIFSEPYGGLNPQTIITSFRFIQ